MLIIATVNCGKAQITKSWDLLQVAGINYVVLQEVEYEKIVIPLDNKAIVDEAPGQLRAYRGTLNSADAVLLQTPN